MRSALRATAARSTRLEAQWYGSLSITGMAGLEPREDPVDASGHGIHVLAVRVETVTHRRAGRAPPAYREPAARLSRCTCAQGL